MSQPSGGQPDFSKFSNLGLRRVRITQPSFPSPTSKGNINNMPKPKMLQCTDVKLKMFRSEVGPLRFLPELVKVTREEDQPVVRETHKPTSTRGSELPRRRRRRGPKAGTGRFSIGKPCPEPLTAPRKQLKWPLINMPDTPEYGLDKTMFKR